METQLEGAVMNREDLIRLASDLTSATAKQRAGLAMILREINRELHHRSPVYDKVTIIPGLGSDCEVLIERHECEVIPFKRGQS